jgi:hypothetical protein
MACYGDSFTFTSDIRYAPYALVTCLYLVLQQTYEQWRKVFGIVAGTYAGGAVVYAVFGSGKLQPWNAAPTATDHDTDGETPEKIPLQDDRA